jgi:hypothetical protein
MAACFYLLLNLKHQRGMVLRWLESCKIAKGRALCSGELKGVENVTLGQMFVRLTDRRRVLQKDGSGTA